MNTPETAPDIVYSPGPAVGESYARPVLTKEVYSYPHRSAAEAAAEIARLKREWRMDGNGAAPAAGPPPLWKSLSQMAISSPVIALAFLLPPTSDPGADALAGALCLGMGGMLLWGGAAGFYRWLRGRA